MDINGSNATDRDDGTETLLHAALDAFEDPFLFVDAEGTLRRWNRAVTSVTGYDDAALTDASASMLFEDEGLDAARGAMQATDRAIVDATVITEDGARLPFEFRVARVTEDDEVVGYSALGRRIDAGEYVERGASLDRMTDAFFAVDDGWHLTYVNEQARPILAAAMGVDEDEPMVGRHLWDAIPAAVGTAFDEQYHAAMADQETKTFEAYYDPLDTWFEVRAYPSATGLSIYFHDVTERRRRQEALEERERTLRNIYDVTGDADRSFDEKVTALFDIGCEVLGLAFGTLSRIEDDEYHFEAVRAPDDSVQAGDTVPLSSTNCERVAADERTLVLSNVARDAPDLADRAGNAEWGIACYLGAPVVVDDDVHGTFCFYDMEPRDEAFTEWEVTLVDLMTQWVSYELTRQRIRDRLRQQNEQLEQFASIVSHDLRNPLTVLDGRLELAEETGDVDHLADCRTVVDRMETLIDDLLALARAGETVSETEPVTLSRAVDDCTNVVATDAATVRVAEDRRLEADPKRLQQLLANLVRNSQEHGASNDVTVTVGALDDGFYVEDDGPGIPEAEREDVFEAGYSTSEEGTGFGLNIVEQVATAHGWTIRVVEGSDGGARFEFGDVDRA